MVHAGIRAIGADALSVQYGLTPYCTRRCEPHRKIGEQERHAAREPRLGDLAGHDVDAAPRLGLAGLDADRRQVDEGERIQACGGRAVRDAGLTAPSATW